MPTIPPPYRTARLQGAKKATGDTTIEEVAIAFPPGTTRAQGTGVLGGDLVGGALGAAAGAVGAGVGLGGGTGMLAAQAHLESSEACASIVLALSPTTLYLLGRHRVGPLASFDGLEIISQIPREDVTAHVAQHGLLKELTLTDSRTGSEYVYEIKPLGSGLGDLLDGLGPSSQG